MAYKGNIRDNVEGLTELMIVVVIIGIFAAWQAQTACLPGAMVPAAFGA
ncbi:prepilin-type N-terminal cleavage/methylation domain-containing protein [Sansalvadorimonas verongulae]|nr:prepilin-type N-terminal cleavage/methylation domain-containing protein [Sansalvadorimonas verongulae]